VDVTLQYFDGCPNWQDADDKLLAALALAGITDVAVHRQLVETVEDAERLGFLGSPTVLIDGVDPFAEPGATPGLSCRVYRTDAGLSGAPSVAQLRAALVTAS
jgi:protein-disulfide isomerase